MPTLKNVVFLNDANPTSPPDIFQGVDYIGTLEVESPTLTKIRRVRRALGTAYNDYTEVRSALIARYGEDGSVRPVMPGWNAFVADYNKHLQVTFEVAETFTLEEITVPGIRLKERELAKLGALFIWPEDEHQADPDAAAPSTAPELAA